MPSRKSREGCILVPHSDDYFIVLGDWGHRQLLWHPELSELKVRVLTLTQVPEGGVQGGHDPPQPTGHGKLPRALLSVVIETMKGELLTYFSFISGIARLLKVIVKGVTLCPQKRLLFSPLSCLSPGRVSLSSHLVPLPTSCGSLSRSYLSRPHRGHCPAATICHWNVSSSESGLLKE